MSRSRLKPLIKVAQMLKKPLENILTYLRNSITNAVTEGLNSKIQMIKSNARGFRSFDNYRICILFFCGKLDPLPTINPEEGNPNSKHSHLASLRHFCGIQLSKVSDLLGPSDIEIL